MLRLLLIGVLLASTQGKAITNDLPSIDHLLSYAYHARLTDETAARTDRCTTYFHLTSGLKYVPFVLDAKFEAAGDGYQPPEYAVDGDRVFLRGCLKVSRRSGS